mmetsp:Transcript_17769/g.29534  ORF Transcript_17769/g.29534 Transcript_17769/m.29534 type:complete len:229 (-) Transcript_17769:796-1482(-)
MAIMCCATAPLPSISHHRRSRTVDSYFHVDAVELAADGENAAPLALNKSSLELSKAPSTGGRPLLARPGHLRHRVKSADFHATVLGGGHRRSTSYKISCSTLASLSSNTSSKISAKPKAVRKFKKGVKFGLVHTRGFNLVVSEHPSVTSGLGIELGWDHCAMSSLSVDEHKCGETNRSSDELLLSRKMRNRKLVQFGDYSERQIFLEERKREISARADFFRPVESFDM